MVEALETAAVQALCRCGSEQRLDCHLVGTLTRPSKPWNGVEVATESVEAYIRQYLHGVFSQLLAAEEQQQLPLETERDRSRMLPAIGHARAVELSVPVGPIAARLTSDHCQH